MKPYEDNDPVILGEALEFYALPPWGHHQSVAMETSSKGTFPIYQVPELSQLSCGPCDELEEATWRIQAVFPLWSCAQNLGCLGTVSALVQFSSIREAPCYSYVDK